MADFLMLMRTEEGDSAQWSAYIDSLLASGCFRGGSALGNGICVSRDDHAGACVTTGFMRFEAGSRDDVLALLPGNPVYEAGGEIEILELVES
ncbi:MAG: hypothetical protein AB8C46_08750 [Burkholderiaceae bacterium]